MAGPTIRLRRNSGLRPGMVFFGVFVLPFAGWAFYNAWDQPLREPARAVLEAKAEAVPDAENLFLAMVAFPIEGDEPAHERGAAALAAYASAQATAEAKPESYAEALGRQSAFFDESAVQLCSPGNREGAYHCLRNSREQRASFAPLLRQLDPLLLRYRELERYPRYADARPVSLELVPDTTAFRIALINLSIIALAMQEGAIEPGALALAQSAAIWRRVLAARDATLIDKMVASRAYAAHLLFVSELVREQPALDDVSLAAIESILRPLADAERSLVGALAGEFRMQAAMWAQITDPSSPIVRKDFPDASAWWYRLLIKKNDSIHRSYADLERLLQIERGGCLQVRAAVEAAAQRAPGAGSGLSWYEWFYNPIGRVLHASMSGPEVLLEYLGRQCNLLALQGMVSQQLEMKRSGVAAEKLAARFLDPNAGAPYGFDAQAQTLSFAFIGDNREFVTPMPLAGGAP